MCKWVHVHMATGTEMNQCVSVVLVGGNLGGGLPAHMRAHQDFDECECVGEEWEWLRPSVTVCPQGCAISTGCG